MQEEEETEEDEEEKQNWITKVACGGGRAGRGRWRREAERDYRKSNWSKRRQIMMKKRSRTGLQK
jgi:hypothetical protein